MQVSDTGASTDTAPASEERYRSLFDGVPIGLFLTTLDGRVIDVNPAFVQLMGYPDKNALLARNAADFYVNPTERMHWTTLLERDRTVIGFETQVRRFDGSARWVRASGQAVRDPSGRIAYLQGAVLDITAQKRAEEITGRRASHLEALNAITASAFAASELPELLEAAVGGALGALGCTLGAGWVGSVHVSLGMPLEIWSSIHDMGQPAAFDPLHPSAVPDWQAAELKLRSLAPVMSTAGIRASASAPVHTAGGGRGGIFVAGSVPRSWLPEEVLLLETVAKEVGEALERLQLFQSATRRTQELEAVYTMSRRLRAARSADEMPHIIVGQALEIMSGTHGTLALLTPERDAFTLAMAVGFRVEPARSRFPLTGTRAGQVVQTGTPFVNADPSTDVLPAGLDLSRNGLVGPLVIVPVQTEQETIGTLAVARPKSSESRPFTDAEVRLLEAIAEIAGTAIRRARLYDDLQQAYVQMVVAFAQAIESRDSYTSRHSERMVRLAEQIARQLGCPEGEVQDIRWGARLHDVGKIGVPDNILNKPGRLADPEWKVMRQHPVLGEQILKSVERMRAVATLVRHHQERWDGTGYPDRLGGEAIPLGSRILAVVDAYGAISERRPYKPARSQAQAVAEIQRCAGTQFDPRVVEALVQVVDMIEPAPWEAGDEDPRVSLDAAGDED